MELVSVKYIGKRHRYVDGAYGTRVAFAQGESRMVPAEKARLMLKHPDVYVPGVADAPIASVPDQPQADSDELQALRDTINAMTEKDALSDYTHIKYGIKLDQRRSIERMRMDAIALVDQYGAV